MELVALQAALDAYQTDRTAHEAAKSQSQIATIAKATKLDELAELMKNDIKLSEVDTIANPEKLTEIGWAPKSPPGPVAMPSQSGLLRIVAEGPGLLSLAWDSAGSGGIARNYIVERREEPAGGGEFGEWGIVGTSLNNEINLTSQPQMTSLEYRVRAVNVTGQSPASNSVAAVL